MEVAGARWLAIFGGISQNRLKKYRPYKRFRYLHADETEKLLKIYDTSLKSTPKKMGMIEIPASKKYNSVISLSWEGDNHGK